MIPNQYIAKESAPLNPRLEDEKEFKSCTGLLHSDQGPLVLDEMYLDTTFLRPHYPTFPSRKAAVDKVWELCTEWVGKNNVLRRGKRKGELNDKFVVVLHTPARYEGKIFQGKKEENI